MRVTAYVVPYTTMVASVPWSQRQGLFVPMDDECTARYSFAVETPPNIYGYGGENLFAVAPFTNAIRSGRTGILPREYTAGNDYQIDREVQRTATFSGVADFVSQDFMVTESMGPIYDRTQEQLGSTDRAITRMRHILLSAAQGPRRRARSPRRSGSATTGPSSARRRSSRPVRTGGRSPPPRTPASPRRSAWRTHSPPSKETLEEEARRA